MSYLHDLANGAVYGAAVTVGNVTTTTTGPAVDMLTGDGVCNLLISTANGVITGLAAQVYQSTASTGTYAAITGAVVTATTNNMTGVPFNRDNRWLQAVFSITGTTSTGVSGFFCQQKKSIVN